MGKKIDIFILSAVSACALYFYFYRNIRNHVLSIALALLCWLLLRRILRKCTHAVSNSSWLKRRSMRRRASSNLMKLACAPKEDAHQQISQLIHSAYDIDCSIETIQLPPTASLSQERLFSTWRDHVGEERLLICTTGGTGDECKILADGLKKPRVALLGAAQLAQLIAEHPSCVYLTDDEKRRRQFNMRPALHMLINRRNAPRCALCSLSMLGMYLMTGAPLYCASALILLLIVLLSLRTAPRPNRLF